MLARLCAFVIWGLVAATGVFWGLRLFVRAPAAPAYAVPVGDTAAVRGDLTRLLGSAPVAAPTTAIAPETSSRFKLFGIVAPKYADAAAPPGHSVALIAVDGKMPKAFAVGARLDGDLVLQSVSLRTVSIATAPGKPAITLELPLPAAAATGTLAPAVGDGGGYVPSTPVPPAFVPARGQPSNASQFANPPLPQPPPLPMPRPDANAPTQ
jgi:general secretion pathway protein C